MKSHCLYVSKSVYETLDIKEKFGNIQIIEFPETGLTYEEQRRLEKFNNCLVITTSVILCTLYKMGEVHRVVNGVIETLNTNIYGASFEIVVKSLDDKTMCMMHESIVYEIRKELLKSPVETMEYLKSLGLSMERSYLIKKLEKET